MAGKRNTGQHRQAKRRQHDIARRRARAQARAAAIPSSPKSQIHHARDYPIYECLVNPEWRESGLAQILLSRRQPNGQLVIGVYLVDLGCLGLKNTFCNANMAMEEYRDGLKKQMSEQLEGGLVSCPVDVAHQIIYGAIRYAAALGFQPDADFKLSQHVLEDEKAFEPGSAIEFGRDGKPFYTQGPRDDAEWVLAQLEKTVGKGNFHYVVALDPPF